MVDDPESVSDDAQPLPAEAAHKPLLASEALMEDLAPEEPWRVGARLWSLAAGVGLLGVTLLGWLDGAAVTSPSGLTTVAAAAIALLAGLLPLPYVARAAAMLVVALTLVGVAFAGWGPLVLLLHGVGTWWLVHAGTAITLPAALLFRDRYRALPRARYVLALALVLALGFVGFCVLRTTTGSVPVQVASVVAIIAVISSLVGFMGSQAPIAGSMLSGLILLAVTAQLALVSGPIDALIQLNLPRVATVLGFAATALLGAVGLAQLLAAGSWGHARSIDFRRDRTERPRLPSLASDSWSGRR